MDKFQKEQKSFYGLISPKLVSYVLSNLNESLDSIHFSREFISYINNNFGKIDSREFYMMFDDELERVYEKGFFQKIVPAYFEKKVIPYIPPSENLLDVGCGTGILAYELGKQSRFQNIEGIDITRYLEWNMFKSDKVSFKIVPPAQFSTYMKRSKFDNAVLTWSLHHMPSEKQESYLKKLCAHLEPDGMITILEDSYSEKMIPNSGVQRWKEFMNLDPDERKNVMSFYDWFANRVLAKRFMEPIPCTYRTLEQWELLGEKIGFETYKKEFIGFPENRDINTPQCLLILKKP